MKLAAERTLATVPFASRYRLIDFVLSSLVKSRVNNIGILTKELYGSLVDHLGAGKDWDLDRRNGGLKILTPFAKADSLQPEAALRSTLCSPAGHIWKIVTKNM